jgi:hypothetical protein
MFEVEHSFEPWSFAHRCFQEPAPFRITSMGSSEIFGTQTFRPVGLRGDLNFPSILIMVPRVRSRTIACLNTN